jgi:hypothetical protein
MNNKNIVDWIQILTGVAVLVGLILVIWELQQTRELARAELASDGWGEMMASSRSEMGETFAATRAKACFAPTQLTDSEILEMRAFNYILRAEVARMRGYAHIGEYDIGWRELAKNNIGVILGNKVGRVSYERAKGNSWPWYEEIAEEMISKKEIISCEEYLTPIFEGVRSENDPRQN